MKALFAIALVCAESVGVRSQQPAPTNGPGRIVVTLRDSVGSDSLVGGSVCTWVGGRNRCAASTSGRRFVIDSLPLQVYTVGAACRQSGFFLGKEIGRVVVRLTDSVPVDRTIDVSYAGCDRRPFRRVSGVMVGHHFAAFEAMSISPCRVDEWFTPADSNRRTWLSFNLDSLAARRLRWPKPGVVEFRHDGELDTLNAALYFVRLHGTLQGPGNYGHMGASSFLFTADSVISIETPRGHDCDRG
jgi:hypothetical protein